MSTHRSLPSCPVCRQLMRFARSRHDELTAVHTFECYQCRLALTGEAVAEAVELYRQARAA
jgi:hypothetical protein